MGKVSTKNNLRRTGIEKGTVHPSIKIGAMVMEGKFIFANTVDDCILGLDLMQKYGRVNDVKFGFLKS